MDFVENIWIGLKRAEARIGAKQDQPSLIFDAGIKGGVGFAEDSSAEGDELTWAGFGVRFHQSILTKQVHLRFVCVQTMELSSLRSARESFHFGDKNFKRAEVQLLRVEVGAGARCAGE